MKINFQTDNAAFSDDKSFETIRILNTVINKIEEGENDGKIFDINGNKIGEWSI
jgi:hypothetical protein